MEALVTTITTEYQNQKYHFLIGFKKGKNIEGMLDLIVPIASQITVASFFNTNQDVKHFSRKAIVMPH